MQNKLLLAVMALLLYAVAVSAQLQSPDDFLPNYRDDFTPHHRLVDYVQHVADNSPRVRVRQYGETNEGRPLLLATIASTANMARIDQIRENNLRRTGLLDGTPDPALDVAIVWVSFGVHGNEASCSESAMEVLYELANPASAKSSQWLENTVVLIDPSLNPDGYDRFTHWYRSTASRRPNANPDVREHNEPWPRGRYNHYSFDLNRDWAWQTQRETQARIKAYHEWMPHVHPDIHEMGYESPYYFAPAAAPYHEYITQWQRDFQVDIGKHHAGYFDKNGWLYFSREIFDLLYPSYGDTYPTYNGAVGMTYEQGGIDAGLAITLSNGDTLTLRDRIAHHATAVLSTIEVTSKNAGRVKENFAKYFKDAQNAPPGQYRTYISKGSNDAGRLQNFCRLLDRNGIRYGRAKGAGLKAYNYADGKTTSVDIAANDVVISAFQPLAVLTQVLLDPYTVVVDSATYDITGWSLPYAYGLEAYATAQKVAVTPGYEAAAPPALPAAAPYAYLATWSSLNNVRFLSALLQQDIRVRSASEPFTLNGQVYPRGSLVINRGENRHVRDFDKMVQQAATQHGQALYAAQTGFVDTGKDLGSDAMGLLKRPSVALLSGKSTSASEFGSAWFFFEEEIDYPIDIYEAEELSRIDLSEYHVLVVPEGRYSWDDAVRSKLSDWVSKGGNLILVGNATAAVANQKGFGLADKKEKKDDDKKEEKPVELNPYAGQSSRYITESVPGAVFKVKLDDTHPLAYGLSATYFSLKTDSQSYGYLESGGNVGTLGSELFIAGFAGAKAQEKLKDSLVFGVERKGRGSVTYLVDNPLFRNFWENGKFLFSNAVFMVGN